MDQKSLTGHQIAAARTLADMTQKDLADLANISVPTLKRMEGAKGETVAMSNNARAVRAALEKAGVVFLADGDSSVGGPGVRLRDSQQ
ncbi:multiprotein-bridging factor 1 family protein [Ensifer sp. YR511]|uniref:helix-turn-helix domain-containing protein n=1 Tax=Ensifer sp. YR511 TaxID=1855294 RepID=UPI000887425C|nr:Helix-turn-helix [Ensifer sp. YR511]